MAKAKIWKIGTKIEYYIDEFIEMMNSYELKIGDHFNVGFNKKTNKVIYFLGEEGEIELFDKTKGIQILKILLSLNFIFAEGIEWFDLDEKFYDQQTYVINSNKKNWRENFIKLLDTYSYLDEEDEDGEDLIKFQFKQHKNTIYSILKTFETFIDKEQFDFEDEDKKAMSYWVVKDLFNDFEDELKIISDNLLYPIIGKVRQRKNLDNIVWKELSVKNLDEVKEGHIESSLWNLSDILSSNKNISIPIMQRKYVWDENLVEKLIEDIFSIKAIQKPFHYIGSIVYKEKDNSIRILDGQQRLTTMFLILTALFSVFISEDAYKFDVEVPKFFEKIFPLNNEDKSKALHNRFKHVYGNDDFDEFSKILTKAESPRKLEQGNMSKNFGFAQEMIKKRFIDTPDKEKQIILENIFINTVQNVAFTVNKNQIESEYEIFEKLNTLSKPLNQIDLMKNHLLPYCKDKELDENEQAIQTSFHKHIFSKFEKNKNISEPSVKRFVKYFIQLNQDEFILTNDDKSLGQFDKLSLILENKFNLVFEGKTFKEFNELLKEIGDEIVSFLSITDRNYYTKKDNKYYDYSDILSSFDQRYVYAPLIKQIFDLYNVDDLKSNKSEDRKVINQVRKILFEIERYELFFQVVIYRGQSISQILDKVTRKVKSIYNEDGEITPNQIRDILNDDEIMSTNLVTPNIDAFVKKVSEESIADKVSLLILNRIKFYHNNKESIELETSFENHYLTKPTREHIISQKITDSETREIIYKVSKDSVNSETYSENEFNRVHKSTIDMIGNILVVESSDNSSFKNKSPMEKLADYKKKPYLEKDPAFVGLVKNQKDNALSLKNYIEIQQLGFDEVKNRSKQISQYLLKIYK